MLEGDAFQDIRDVFTTVRSFLEILVNLFPLNHGDRVFFLLKKGRDRISRNAIGLIFQAVHQDAAFRHIRMMVIVRGTPRCDIALKNW